MNIPLIVVVGIAFLGVIIAIACISFFSELVRCQCGCVYRMSFGIEEFTCPNCGLKYTKYK